MLVTHNELLRLVKSQVITNVREGAVNGSSIDVHLADTFMLEARRASAAPIDLAAGMAIPMDTVTLGAKEKYALAPGEFILGATQEVFNLPAHISMLFVMKSRLARSGLDQMNAAWCNPGWSCAALTVELINVTTRSTLLLSPGMPIGQMVVFKGEAAPLHALYDVRGRFNNRPRVSVI